MLLTICQFAIPIFGLIAVWTSQTKDTRIQKWASVFGLAAQPFWFYSMWITQQWGVFFTCFLFLVGYARGFYNFWIRSEK